MCNTKHSDVMSWLEMHITHSYLFTSTEGKISVTLHSYFQLFDEKTYCTSCMYASKWIASNKSETIAYVYKVGLHVSIVRYSLSILLQLFHFTDGSLSCYTIGSWKSDGILLLQKCVRVCGELIGVRHFTRVSGIYSFALQHIYIAVILTKNISHFLLLGKKQKMETKSMCCVYLYVSFLHYIAIFPSFFLKTHNSWVKLKTRSVQQRSK